MKTLRKMVKIINRKKLIGSLFILFSLFFFVFSLTNNTKESTKINENEENKVMSIDDIYPSILPYEKNIVALPDETETSVDETTTFTETKITTEVETETLTEIQTEPETQTEMITESKTEPETEIETEIETAIETEVEKEIEAQIEPNNYSSLDEYIYSLINTYSGYNTRIDLTYENVYLLGQLIYSEAGVEPYEGQIAVGEVVLNRLYSSNEYSGIYDVIFKPGQFDVVTYGTIYNVPSEESILAGVHAILGETPTNGAIYFDDPRICTSWASKNRPYAIKIGNHQFYY